LRIYRSENQKKIGIVASLMHEPELLILDEPTSGSDPLMQQTFLSLLAKAKNAVLRFYFPATCWRKSKRFAIAWF
jgi:ABC-type multidrug transport system ATPase subunit